MQLCEIYAASPEYLCKAIHRRVDKAGFESMLFREVLF
jgi:hypothetical protein